MRYRAGMTMYFAQNVGAPYAIKQTVIQPVNVQRNMFSLPNQVQAGNIVWTRQSGASQSGSVTYYWAAQGETEQQAIQSRLHLTVTPRQNDPSAIANIHATLPGTNKRAYYYFNQSGWQFYVRQQNGQNAVDPQPSQEMALWLQAFIGAFFVEYQPITYTTVWQNTTMGPVQIG
ncbi:MAG: hypothetical protein K2Q23_00080 [Bryobacteraceae bacterium]|nr:hypothetical protein [Bryobacteraceae bacterium]